MLIEHNVSSGAAEIVFLTDWRQSDIFKLFPGYPLHFYSEKWHELLKFSVFVKKPTLLAMESLRPQHHPSPIRSVFTFSSLVALLALLASILFIISSLFRFHDIHFCKFDCFTCHCSKIHFALNEIHTAGLWNDNISILASKDNIQEFGLNSGMRGHWNKQLVFLIP